MSRRNSKTKIMSKLEAKDMKRGAIPSPRHHLAAATPHKIIGTAPANFIYLPKELSFWGNDIYGDCVSAEEAFAKACNNPEIFFSYDNIVSWATANGYINGAFLTSVLQTMQSNGFQQSGITFNDGPYTSVDWTNAPLLQNAISCGPVKIGVAADQFNTVTPSRNGWFLTGLNPDTKEDHCVSLCGYGTMSWLAQQLGVSVPSGVNGDNPGYAMFTWNSIGIIDVPSMINITAEAWLRNPTTVSRIGYLTTQGCHGIWQYTIGSIGVPTPIPSTAGLGFRGIIAIGNTVYMTTQGCDGIWQYTIGSSGAPTQIPLTAGLGFRGIMAIGNILYMTTQGCDGIWQYTIGSTGAPTQIPLTAGLGFSGIISIGKILYMTTQGADGIWQYTIGSIGAPTPIPSTAGLGFSGILL
jgi:hypothetical protein